MFEQYYRNQIRIYFLKTRPNLFDKFGYYKDITKLFNEYNIDLNSNELHSKQFTKMYNLLY